MRYGERKLTGAMHTGGNGRMTPPTLVFLLSACCDFRSKLSRGFLGRWRRLLTGRRESGGGVYLLFPGSLGGGCVRTYPQDGGGARWLGCARGGGRSCREGFTGSCACSLRCRLLWLLHPPYIAAAAMPSLAWVDNIALFFFCSYKLEDTATILVG